MIDGLVGLLMWVSLVFVSVLLLIGQFDAEPGPSAQQCIGIGGVPTPDGLCLLYVAPPPGPLAKQALPEPVRPI